MEYSRILLKKEKYRIEVIVKSIFLNKSIFELSNFNLNIFKNTKYKYREEIHNKLIRIFRFDSKKLINTICII